jgi:hypothetical protein
MERHLASFGNATEAGFFTVGVISPLAFSYGAWILRNVPVDWAAAGVATDDDLQGLAEILMRLFLSFLQHPSTPALTDDGIRVFVRRWIGPALRG